MIRWAIRWLRSNAARYNLDPNHIAIMGDSSGGWTAAMAAVTGDAPEMEGAVGTVGVSSQVQAAVAFFISLPKAPHGNWNGFLTNDALREAATMRSTSAAGCTVTHPTPYTPTWQTVIDFLDKYMKG